MRKVQSERLASRIPCRGCTKVIDLDLKLLRSHFRDHIVVISGDINLMVNVFFLRV